MTDRHDRELREEDTVPLYEFRCRDCGHTFEEQLGFDDDPPETCPSCGSDQVRKVFSPVGISFTGAGFYKTDSRSGSGGGTSSAASGDGGSGSDSGSGSGSGSDSSGGPAKDSGSTGGSSKEAGSSGGSSGQSGSTGGTSSSSGGSTGSSTGGSTSD